MISFEGSDWGEVERHVELSIKSDLDALKNHTISHDDTQYYRGRIAAMEELLDLPNRKDDLKAMMP